MASAVVAASPSNRLMCLPVVYMHAMYDSTRTPDPLNQSRSAAVVALHTPQLTRNKGTLNALVVLTVNDSAVPPLT
jgi:hypothetical protein